MWGKVVTRCSSQCNGYFFRATGLVRLEESLPLKSNIKKSFKITFKNNKNMSLTLQKPADTYSNARAVNVSIFRMRLILFVWKLGEFL